MIGYLNPQENEYNAVRSFLLETSEGYKLVSKEHMIYKALDEISGAWYYVMYSLYPGELRQHVIATLKENRLQIYISPSDAEFFSIEPKHEEKKVQSQTESDEEVIALIESVKNISFFLKEWNSGKWYGAKPVNSSEIEEILQKSFDVQIAYANDLMETLRDALPETPAIEKYKQIQE